MSVRIQLDQDSSKPYTNLDFLSGRVFAIFPNDATISAINVKLEGESRSRLMGPKQPYNERSDKKRTELEVHKVLYQVHTVFPTPEIRENAGSSQFTLLAGQYVYPFKFKFPFNNDCTKNTSVLNDLKVGKVNVQFAPDINKHVKKTLPPSMTGFPGLADIRYYVKATVVRPKFYQENIRNQVHIKFLPIEDPRPPDRHEETFARRKQQFQKYPQPPGKKGLFKKSTTTPADQEPPTYQVDARLPSPAIITCNEPLPLRVLVQRLGDSDATVILSMFQIELFAYTNVRARDLDRTESGSWVLTSLANMNMPLHSPKEKSPDEWKLPSRLWDNIPLPNTVAPTFETCNISRTYELEIRVGLSHSVAGGLRPELIVLPLRLPVQVYSGIRPPPELLGRMASRAKPHVAPIFPKPNKQAEAQSYNGYHPDQDVPSTPTQEHNAYPAQMGSQMPPQTDIPDEAPPSYEDAMADDIGPVDGPRRNYNVNETEGDQLPAFNSDSKSGLGRRVSERLFDGPRRATSGFSNNTNSPIHEDSSLMDVDTEEAKPELPSRTGTEKQS